MARNGSGTFNRGVADYVNGTVIDETKVNQEMDEIATALTQSIAVDGQSTVTANIPFNSKKLTGVASGSARTDASNVGDIADGTYTWGGTGGGTADVITLSLSPAITAYVAGQKYAFIASGANTTNVTLNIDSVGAKAVTKNGTTALVAGDIPNAAIVLVQYDGTQFQLLNINATGDFTYLDVDNITIDGNTISSTNTDGNVVITPNGDGIVVLDGINWPIADGNANEVLTTDGAGQGSWEPPYAPGHIYGLQLSPDAGDTTNDVQIEVGNCIDSADSVKMVLSSILTKQIDVNWAVGDNAGGFPSGLTLTNDTWYHVFLIKRTDTGVVDAGFDTSTTAANLLTDASDYDAYRRIGRVIRSSSANNLHSGTGSVVQVVNIQEGAVATGTTTIPNDDTIPQNTEGDQYMSLAITPFNAKNKLRIDVTYHMAHSVGGRYTGALFQDSTADALCSGITVPATSNVCLNTSFTYYMIAGTASETTFKLRLGSSTAGTTTFNGESGARLRGGVLYSSITITEIEG